MKKEKLQELREELGDVERMLKAMIKSLEKLPVCDYYHHRPNLALIASPVLPWA